MNGDVDKRNGGPAADGGAMADALLLKTRVDLLRRSLNTVRTVLESVERQRDDLQGILRFPGLVEERVGLIKELAKGVRGAMAMRDPDGLEHNLGQIENVIGNLDDAVLAAELSAQKIGLRSPQASQALRTTLDDELFSKASEEASKLDVAEERLAEAADAQARGETDKAIAASTEAWTILTAVLPNTQDLFSEYVELLHGLAVRDTGFDRGICRIADELIRNSGLPGGYRWESLTLPGSDEMLSATYMIRLGFPEWTIWALPLSAHVYGSLFAGRVKQIVEFVQNAHQGERERDAVRVCVADAFATYVVGPAYACAVLLMRLDPLRALSDEDGRLDARRAAVVLYALDRLNRLNEDSGYFDELVDGLRIGWESALRQAGWSDQIEDTDEFRGGLQPDEVAAVRKLVSKVAQVLGENRAFPVDEWGAVTELADALAERRAHDIDLSPNIDPRHVLNAAWRCRWELDDLRQIDRIESDAMELWEHLHAPVRTGAETTWMARAGRQTQAGARAAPQSAGAVTRPPNPRV